MINDWLFHWPCRQYIIYRKKDSQYWYLTDGLGLYSVFLQLEMVFVMRKVRNCFCIYCFKDIPNCICYLYMAVQIIFVITQMYSTKLNLHMNNK